MGHGEYHMKVIRWDKLLFSSIYPLLFLCVLAQWTMSVATRVVAIMMFATIITNINIPSQCRGSTSANRIERSNHIAVAMFLYMLPMILEYATNDMAGSQ